MKTMKMSPPQTPQEIRDLLRTDPTLITDQQLLALLLARGSTRRRQGEVRESYTTVALANVLYEETGGSLVDLVRKTCDDDVDLKWFGIGKSIGAHLIAGMDLADRWRRGFKDKGDSDIRPGDNELLRELVFRRSDKTSEGELIAVILGSTYPDKENTRHLLEELENPQNLMSSLTLDAFESFRKSNVVHLRLPKTKAEIEFGSFCRLFATVELAHRYCAQTGPKPLGLKPGAFGLKSAELAQLLDPRSPLNPELRKGMIEVLRSHPELAKDFAKLDALAQDAGVKNYQRAIELHQMFEELRKRTTWTHPAQLLGEKIPYGGLLAIANAKIERASRPPVRILKIKELLEQAEQDAVAEPIDNFVEVLLSLSLSKASVETMMGEIMRRYLERQEQYDRQGVSPS